MAWGYHHRVSFAIRVRSSQQALLRCRSSRSYNFPLPVLVANAIRRLPSTSIEAELGPGAGPFPAEDPAHPFRPAFKVQQAVNSATSAPSLLSRAGTTPIPGPVGRGCWCPARGEPGRIGQPAPREARGEGCRAASPISADQHFLAGSRVLGW